jgi:hypothetical protein
MFHVVVSLPDLTQRIAIGDTLFVAANHLLTLHVTRGTPALHLFLIVVLHGARLGVTSTCSARSETPWA